MRRGFGASPKSFLIIVLCLSAGYVAAASILRNTALAQSKQVEDVQGPADMDIITIDHKDYESERQGPVQFTHRKHALVYGILCWDCHHVYKDGKNLYLPWGKTQKCEECHDPSGKQENVIGLEASFHQNCKNCHKKRDIYQGEPRAYENCNKCHVNLVMIENTVYKEREYGPVRFQHLKHYEKYEDLEGEKIACKECHHRYEDGENVWEEGDPVKACATPGCHDPVKELDGKQYKLRIAYHVKCKTCHKAMVEAGKIKPEEAPYKSCLLCMGKRR